MENPIYIYIYLHVYIYIWGFPEIGVPPVLIHFNGIVHEINHPAIGVPPF